MLLTFTYLVKQDHKTWDEFANSIYLLEKNVLKKLSCDFNILVFSEGSPNAKAKRTMSALESRKGLSITNKIISLKDYVKRLDKENYIEKFPHSARCEMFTSLGYRDMCKFFSYDVFNDENLKDSDYFIRVDTDSFFLDTSKVFIDSLNNLDCDYGYLLNTDQPEDKAVSVGFGNCLYEYCEKNSNQKFLNDHYFRICTEATLKPYMFYTNFEVVNLNWAKSQNHVDILKHIIKAKGIYNYRWGDNIIRYYCVKLLKGKIKVLKGCLYKHSGMYDSRNIFRKAISKVYAKLTNNLHKNNFENKLTFLDKLFLGIRI